MHPGSQGGAKANAWQAVFLLLIWKQGDALGFVRHGDDVLIVHHEASRGVAAQVDVDEEVVVASTKQTCEYHTDRMTVINTLHSLSNTTMYINTSGYSQRVYISRHLLMFNRPCLKSHPTCYLFYCCKINALHSALTNPHTDKCVHLNEYYHNVYERSAFTQVTHYTVLTTLLFPLVCPTSYTSPQM